VQATLTALTTNTDSIIKKLVTVFAFVPALKTNLQWELNLDTRICSQLKSCTETNFRLRDKLYRDTAQVCIYQPSATETIYWPLINLVPRHTYNPQSSVPGLQKHAPCFTHYGLRSIISRFWDTTHGLHSFSNAF